MRNFESHTIEELLQIAKSSDDSIAFVELLKMAIEKVADVRNEIDKENDSIELRAGIVKVINNELINPLIKVKTVKKIEEPTDYT